MHRKNKQNIKKFLTAKKKTKIQEYNENGVKQKTVLEEKIK
jgi:hypothetical protein